MGDGELQAEMRMVKGRRQGRQRGKAAGEAGPTHQEVLSLPEEAGCQQDEAGGVRGAGSRADSRDEPRRGSAAAGCGQSGSTQPTPFEHFRTSKTKVSPHL